MWLKGMWKKNIFVVLKSERQKAIKWSWLRFQGIYLFLSNQKIQLQDISSPDFLTTILIPRHFNHEPWTFQPWIWGWKVRCWGLGLKISLLKSIVLKLNIVLLFITMSTVYWSVLWLVQHTGMRRNENQIFLTLVCDIIMTK